MKYLVAMWILLSLSANVYAQNYETYLKTAFEQLASGNIESAKRHYSVYKQLTQKTNDDFEFLLAEKEEKGNNDWQKDCHIISLGGDDYIAVKKGLKDNMVEWETADALARNYHGGGFEDWRLPTESELATICNVVDLGQSFKNMAYFWTSYSKTIGKTREYVALDETGKRIVVRQVDFKGGVRKYYYLIVRKFTKTN